MPIARLTGIGKPPVIQIDLEDLMGRKKTNLFGYKYIHTRHTPRKRPGTSFEKSHSNTVSRAAKNHVVRENNFY